MKCSRLLVVIFALLACILCSCTKQAGTAGGFDWPVFRGPDHNGQSRETNWNPAAIASPKILWTANIGSGYSNVVIQRERLYTTGLSKEGFTVSCLDASTGKIIWQQPLASVTKANLPQTTPAVDGDSLFILTFEGYLFCLDSRTGRQKWQKDIVRDYGAAAPFYHFGGSPVVVGDLVVLTANAAGMAVERKTGKLAWTSEAPPEDFGTGTTSTGTGYCTPVPYKVDGRQLALFESWQGVTSVDVKTGKPVWQYEWEYNPVEGVPDPVISGNKVCVSWASGMPGENTNYGFVLGMSGEGAELLWKTHDLDDYLAPPVIVDGSIYTMYGGPCVNFRHPTTFRCLDLETGKLMWDVPLGQEHANKCFAVTAANGILIVLDDEGTLYTANASPDGFKEIAHCDVLQGANLRIGRIFWTPPVLCNAKIYSRNARGDLVCIDVSK